MKTCWTRLQDVLIKTNIFALALRLQKTSSRRLQDVLVKTNIFVLAIRLQDVFKTFSRRLQDAFKSSCQDVFKTSWKMSSRHLQGVLKTFWERFRDIFKTSCKDIFKTFSRRMIKLNCFCQHVFEKHSARFWDVLFQRRLSTEGYT